MDFPIFALINSIFGTLQTFHIFDDIAGGVSTKIQDIMHFSEVVVSGRRGKSILVHMY